MRKSIGIVIMMGAATVGCAANSSNQPITTASAQSCAGVEQAQVAELFTDKVTAVRPIQRTEFIARAIQPKRVVGAELYVPAERGVSEAFLERVLSCHARSNAAAEHPNDPLRVDGVARIDVDSVGGNHRVAITGQDHKAGKAILERARLLENRGSVQVQQVAAATGLSHDL